MQLMEIAQKDGPVKRTFSGLAPVLCYDPDMSRSMEGIKDALLDNIPVLFRWHSAAEFPIQDARKPNQLDLEARHPWAS